MKTYNFYECRKIAAKNERQPKSIADKIKNTALKDWNRIHFANLKKLSLKTRKKKLKIMQKFNLKNLIITQTVFEVYNFRNCSIVLSASSGFLRKIPTYTETSICIITEYNCKMFYIVRLCNEALFFSLLKTILMIWIRAIMLVKFRVWYRFSCSHRRLQNKSTSSI